MAAPREARPMQSRRYRPTRLAAAIIIGIMAAVVFLILYRGVWL
jgi:hypothetical protein